MVGRWMQRMDLPEEATGRRTIIEILEDKRVLIEHHSGVTEYGQKQICVKVAFGRIRINGSGLDLKHMSCRQLIICGRIDSLGLERGSGNG